MVESRIEFEVEVLLERYEWLVSYKEIDINDNGEVNESEVYVVSINYNDIDFEENKINYIHIENIDYLYDISGGEGEIIERCYDIFSVIEREVVEEIKSL